MIFKLAVQIEPFNLSDNTIKVRANLQLNGACISGLTNGYYSFDEPHKMVNDSRWIESKIAGIPIETAREIESAKVSNRFREFENILKFEVLGARELQ